MKALPLLIFAALSGCAVTAKSRIEGPAQASASGPVCLLAGAAPDHVTVTRVGRIVATKRSYGGSDQLMKPIADEARSIGANAVLYLQTDQKFKGPLPWRVVSPSGQGIAVRAVGLDCAAAGGVSL